MRPFVEFGSWRSWLSRGLDLIYPASCALCEAPLTHGRALCSGCHRDLPLLRQPHCAHCGEPFSGQFTQSFACPNCAKLRFAFRFARPALVRDDRTLDLIHRLKYARQIHLAAELARLIKHAFEDPRLREPWSQRWPLIPVPLHPARKRHRHFNQAEEIALALSRLTGLDMVNALSRKRATETQTALTRAQRLANLRSAFAITRKGLRAQQSSPRGAILIDDVLTTGATADACARVLKRAGFRDVCVVVVMRG